MTYLHMIQEGDGKGGGECKERKEQNDKANMGNDLSVTLWTQKKVDSGRLGNSGSSGSWD